ncbi:galectin-6 [Orussus abietinus]|uniref:galectin-6 n=1 Tax=Orussus abietinus TaxID=222816 RepID=UPI0006269C52|nr:galectin-6 [Orussus abietinus]
MLDEKMSNSVRNLKVEALKNFNLVDTEAKALDLDKPRKLDPLKTGSTIIVTGYILPNATRFSVNLTCKTPETLALHFNPRLDRQYVVRNTKRHGTWEEEEPCAPIGVQGFSFKRSTYFHLMIFCSPNSFQIAVNGDHFCEFAFRVPLETITGIEVTGHVEDVKTRQCVRFVYPDPNILKTSPALQLDGTHILEENLEMPVNVDLNNGFRTGARLFVKGRLKLLPHSFYLNLQKGKFIYPHPVIALHLNPRFLYGRSPPCVVLNCWQNGSWSREERQEGHLFWGPGREFLLTVRCERDAWTIWLDNTMIGEFKHRLDPTIIDSLRIVGDVIIHQLAVNYK